MSKTKLLHVFTDFDGTITDKEICLEIFKKYCRNYDDALSRFLSEEISLKEIWRMLSDELPPDLPEEEILAFIDNFEPDPYFKTFYEYCKSLGIPVTVVSDGFDIYIRRILENAGMGEIPSRSNLLVREDGRYLAKFPGAGENCSCNAASCKRNVLLTNSPDEAVIAYIGDGGSDFCAVKYSDLVFAKKRLAVYCSRNKIPHYPVKSFFDVKQRLKAVIDSGKIKQRNQAAVNRKNAFEAE